jgi:dienelactone hydrolase
MARRDFSHDRFLEARGREIKPLFRFTATTPEEARDWRTRALGKIRDLLGEMPESVPLNPEIVEKVDMGSYVREKVIFDADAHSSVPAYILIPKQLDAPARALLCMHGHGPGKDAVAGITTPDSRMSEEEKRRSIEQHNYDYAQQFVQRGYVTFTFDFRCFGERADTSVPLYNRDLCNVHFIRGSLLGINLLALDIHDSFRALDYLCQRPEVDASRIGCVGLSFGGTMTLWTTALDKRIKAAVISGYLCELSTFALGNGNFCGSQYVPGLFRYFDIPDIAALIAPRPLLIESGIHDDGFPIESANRAYNRLQKAYEACGASDSLAHDVFDGGHSFHGELAYDWFDRWL